MTITKFDNGFTLVRNAKVEVIKQPMSRNGKLIGDGAKLIIDNQFEHCFDPKHSVSQSLLAGTDALQQRFMNGSFFFKDIVTEQGEEKQELITYQDGHYRGFIHSDDNIAELIQHIGSTHNFDRSAYTNTTSKNVRLQNVRSNVELQIPGYATGGEMNSQLSFVWDPFQAHIRAAYKIIRLVCSNGMVGMADFMNSKIPMVNDWQRHMEIVDKQLQNRMTNMIGIRMQAMSQSHASIRDCFRIKNACLDRLNDVNIVRTPDEIKRLQDICLAVDPVIHLTDKVDISVLNDGRMADVTGSHLSEFTVWNFLTEMATHTKPSAKNTQAALHKHANAILVDRDGGKIHNISQRVHQKLAFQDVDAAFARDMVSF